MPRAPEETGALVRAAQTGDSEAMAQLTAENLGLIHAALRRFPSPDTQDLFQAGCVGLIDAIRRFDPNRGVCLSTYAVPYILGEMKKYMRGNHSVHIPRSLQGAAQAAQHAAHTLRSELGREPTFSEIAEHMGIDPEELVLALESRTCTLSLDAPLSEEKDHTLSDTLPDMRQQAPFERVHVQEMLERCPENERILLALRYYRGLSQADTARALGVGQPYVSRLEKRALTNLRAVSI